MVGLGNPGPRYAATRHNVGFRVLGAFARRHGARLEVTRPVGRLGVAIVAGGRTGLLEPATFMNASGRAVAAVLARHPELDAGRDLVVVYDDLDLPPGRIRLRPRGGAGGHRGLASVIDEIGSGDFARLRFGVGRPPIERAASDYVLEPFDPGERDWVEQRIVVAADALTALLETGIGPAMDRFNADVSSDD